MPKPRNPEWRTLHGVADSKREILRRTFLEGMREFSSNITLAELERAIESGDPKKVEDAIPWDELPPYLEDMAEELITIVRDGARASEKYLPEAVQMRVRFDLLNPRSVEFIRQYRFDLIREITDASREGVQKIIQRAFEEGMHPYKAARLIRDVVGLTDTQALAVDNFRRGLLAQGVPEGKALERAQRYAERLHRRRAETIARTETIRAASAGQSILWQEGVAEGLIQPSRTWRVWITTPDDRLCPICEQMDGQRVRIQESFQSALGAVYAPPVHPNCRCAVALEFEE